LEFYELRTGLWSVASCLRWKGVELDLLGLMQQLGALPEPEQSEEAIPT
jgi:hypothetical protein